MENKEIEAQDQNTHVNQLKNDLFADTEIIEEVKQFTVELQTEEEPVPKSDEKFTSIENDGFLINNSSVQTQSIINKEAGTEVENLVEKSDQVIETESPNTEDKGNQNLVMIAESGNDPIVPRVANQSINTNLVGEESRDEKLEEVKLSEENIEEILEKVVQNQMKEITPLLMEECKKFLLAQQKEIGLKDESCYDCGNFGWWERRFYCSYWANPKKLVNNSIKESANYNFVSCVNRSLHSFSSHRYNSLRSESSHKSYSRSRRSIIKSPWSTPRSDSQSQEKNENSEYSLKRSQSKSDNTSITDNIPIPRRRKSFIRRWNQSHIFSRKIGDKYSGDEKSSNNSFNSRSSSDKFIESKKPIWRKRRYSSSDQKSQNSTPKPQKINTPYSKSNSSDLSSKSTLKIIQLKNNKDIEDVDPVVYEEEIKKQEEFPEMVKRSVMLEYKPFDNSYIKKLRVKWNQPQNIVHIIHKDTDTFNVEFEAINWDTIENTRWPIYSTLCIVNTKGNELENCTSTNKEVRVGVKAKFSAKIKTPKDKKLAVYVFQCIDEFKRPFGEPINVKFKIVDANIIDLTEEISGPDSSAFEEEQKHEADKLYPAALKQIDSMGIDLTDKAKDLLLKVNGRIEDFFENFEIGS